MAKEAGIGLGDLAEIALYNIIALWLKDHGEVVMEGSEALTLPPRALDLSRR